MLRVNTDHTKDNLVRNTQFSKLITNNPEMATV
jgi:hypothetical protein